MVIIPETMTVKEVMEALHLSRRSVERLCDSGRLRYTNRVSRRHILIYAEDVSRLLQPVNP